MPQEPDRVADTPLKNKGNSDMDAFNSSMLNSTTNGVLATDTAGITLLANKVAIRSLGVVPGLHLREVVPELWIHAEQTIADGVARRSLFVKRGEITYLATVSPIQVKKNLAGILCVLTDSTELEVTAKKLRFFQELAWEQDAIINSSSDGLWISDGDGNVLRINPASERLNDIKADEVVGHNMRDLVAAGLFDRSVTLDVIQTRATVNIVQTRGKRNLMVTGNPVFDDAGNLIRVVANERDLTEIDELQRELEEQQLIKDRFRNQILEMQLEELESRRIIAKSPPMVKALRQAQKVSTVDSTVLILGESGVGKGLIADIIHKYSSRSEKPMIKINCGAIPESLIEAELFGYEKGAFTGAQATGKPGHFEMADMGIIFLDEIAELPFSSQVKILRFLEDNRVVRVGGTSSRQINVRILAATHQDLAALVEKGKFRLDLYYRLNVIPIHVPSLRERKECILPLLRYYLNYFAQKHGIKRHLSCAAYDALLSYQYPGNVRELMNLCERLVVMSETELIDRSGLPGGICNSSEDGIPGEKKPANDVMSLPEKRESVERETLIRARDQYGSQCRIASALGVSQATVARKMKKYGIS
ncbi:MAG: sigma 54-interacting transcriptional regulator [Deltaproteobacteria bacterium]|nr:sigma 54-interacting transcriptional regulator [Deltaproteobacteria bacterium]